MTLQVDGQHVTASASMMDATQTCCVRGKSSMSVTMATSSPNDTSFSLSLRCIDDLRDKPDNIFIFSSCGQLMITKLCLLPHPSPFFCSSFSKLKSSYFAGRRNKRVDKLLTILLKVEHDSFFKAAATVYGLRTATNVAEINKRHGKGIAILLKSIVRV